MKSIRILTFIFLFFLSPTLSAAPIDSKQAAKIADEFMESVKKRFPTGYTRTVIDLKEVYVINYWAPNQRLGFVVVAGDDSLPSKVLAFSMEGEIKKKNKTISAVLEDYCSEIREWQAGKSISTEDTIYYQQKERFCPSFLKGIAWDQNAPYNQRIPLDVDGKHSVVGCIAVSMGQIMKYYQYPDHGAGQNTYMNTNKNGKVFSMSVDYDSLQIDWSSINNKYSLNDSKKAINTVSLLLYYCAVSAEANFSSDATGAGIRNASIGMFKHFGYHPSIRNIEKSEITDASLEQLLYRELDAKRPVLCSGNSHAFVCDGYVDHYFHFNWGWGGRMNGYFLLSAVKAGLNNYKMIRSIALNIRPLNLKEDHHRTVSLSEPGTLSQHLSDNEIQTLTSLTLIGKLNGKDLKVIRKMAGSTETVWETSGELQKLDLSKAEITSDFENPYISFDVRKEKRTITISGKHTMDKQPKLFMFENLSDEDWDLLCQLKRDRDYKNQAWKYVKQGNNYFLQYFTNSNIITSYLFKDCTNLSELILPENTLEISQSAFNNCYSLQQMEIPEHVSEINPQAWKGCLSIKAVSAHRLNTSFADKNGVLYAKNFSTLIYYPSYKTDTVYLMPQSVINLRSYTFNQALFLKDINLSKQITKIPEFAFYRCPSLQNVKLPENVTEVYNKGFYRCNNLSKVYLPSTLKKVGCDVFHKCNNLTDIYCESTVPPIIENNIFKELPDNENIKLWIPHGATESYRQTPWNCFKNISELF